jgi:ureidoacrylate peracid hydrolase
MPMDPTTTAVVLIEYQNDFTSEGGVLHCHACADHLC